GAPDTLLRMSSAPLGMRVMRRRASFISAPVVFTHSYRMASARGSLGTPNAFATQSAVMSPWVGPIPPVVKTYVQRCRSALSASTIAVSSSPTTHFLEIDADRHQIFRNVADVLVLGAAGQDLATDHQERGRDNLFGSGRVGGWHNHLRAFEAQIPGV